MVLILASRFRIDCRPMLQYRLTVVNVENWHSPTKMFLRTPSRLDEVSAKVACFGSLACIKLAPVLRLIVSSNRSPIELAFFVPVRSANLTPLEHSCPVASVYSCNLELLVVALFMTGSVPKETQRQLLELHCYMTVVYAFIELSHRGLRVPPNGWSSLRKLELAFGRFAASRSRGGSACLCHRLLPVSICSSSFSNTPSTVSYHCLVSDGNGNPSLG